ncbi:rhomboid family intramembrane serine protease [Candidatus Bathyarchaeota archaeon]|nr:rhomboid family intramembrane serine protease [Candidatus Bathyarchaeota archaeon]
MKTYIMRWRPTHILIAANIIMYIITSIAGGNIITTNISPVYLYTAQFNYLIHKVGWQTINGISIPCPALWQLFTAIFVHANLLHLFGNMFFLLIFGYRAEVLFHSREYYLIYFTSGLLGNVLSLFLIPDYTVKIFLGERVYELTSSVGASGAIFGLFGASVIFIRRAVGQSIVGALIYAFFLLMMNIGPGVNVFAHFGGLVAGLLIGYWLAKRRIKAVYSYTYSY